MWTFGRKIALGFAVSLLLLLAVGVVAYRSVDTLARASYSVAHTHQVLERIGGVLARLVDAETGERGYILTGDESYLEPYRSADASVSRLMTELRSLTADNPNQQKRLDALEPLIQERLAELRQRTEVRRQGGLEAAAKAVQDGNGVTMRNVRGLLAQMENEERDLLRQRAEEVEITSSGVRTAIATCTVIGLLFVFAAGFLLTRSLTTQIVSAVRHIQASSTELQAAATQQATSAKQSSTSMTEITTTISELLASSRQIAESARQVAGVADHTASAAQSGDTTVRSANESIASIREQVGLVVQHTLELGRKSQQIGAVLDIVSELAEQTNILAINATIEAAGAGEGGRRFAVVADEIRKLADRVSGSAKEIRTLIDDVRGAVNTTVMATETGSKAVDAGSREFADVASAFGQIAGMVNSATQASREIELSTKQQATAVEQVNLAVASTAQAAKETEVSLVQTLQTASQLATLSQGLLRLVQAESAEAGAPIDSMAKDAFRYFRIEARELLDQLGARVLDLEHGATGREGVPALLRLAHTLKGAARVVRQPGIAEAAHRIEDALVPWRDEGGAVAREGIATVLSELASVETLLAALPAPEGGAPAGAAAPGGASPRPDKEARSLRTDVAQMDGLLGGIARAHALVDGLRRSRGDAASARTFVRRLRTPAAAGMSVPGPGGGVAHDSGALVDALHTAVDRLDQGLGESIEHIERELRELQERAERLRLVPADIVFAKLERSARDVAGSLGKEVELQTQGGDVRVDASMLEVVEGALVQLVRNAVAHGIEMPARRQSQGKPRAGRITVEVRRSGRRLLFVCGDDGAGIDLDAVRRTARRKGLLADGAADDEPTLLALLMQGDLSTSPVVTEIAGRGVGLDLARAAAERLGGSLSARTVANRGTTLELAVPISLAALDVLMVRAGGGVAGVPLDALRRTVRLGAGDIGRSGPRETIEVDGRSVPYVALARLLRPDEAVAAPERVTALLVEHGQAWAAVGVDRLHEVAAAVLRPLPEFAPACDLVAGLLVGVDGLPRLVLDPAAMIHAAQRAEAAPGTNRPVPDPVLVVDDSLTTRMLETSILESAGYAVDAAVSGEEGLERARRRRYALFLVDVEMPGMDGFTFIERTRADPALRDIPAVLVSSRASLADRQRGAAAGAQGYIVKGEFVQDEFLARVRQLVGTP